MVTLSSHQSYSRKLPTQRRLKKVAICRSAVAVWRCDGCTTQDHLVDHEFSVVLAYCARGFSKSRIGKICRVCPLPTRSPIEFVVRRFPFKLCGQPCLTPFGIRGRFVE